MALDYYLEIATDLAPDRLAEEALCLLGTAGVRVDAHAEEPLWRSILASDYAIAPTVSLSFRVERARASDLAPLVVCAWALVLDSHPGDAVVFQDATVLLLRARGRLVLNQDAAFWTPEQEAGLGLPHERGPLSPLLRAG